MAANAAHFVSSLLAHFICISLEFNLKAGDRLEYDERDEQRRSPLSTKDISF